MYLCDVSHLRSRSGDFLPFPSSGAGQSLDLRSAQIFLVCHVYRFIIWRLASTCCSTALYRFVCSLLLCQRPKIGPTLFDFEIPHNGSVFVRILNLCASFYHRCFCWLICHMWTYFTPCFMCGTGVAAVFYIRTSVLCLLSLLVYSCAVVCVV